MAYLRSREFMTKDFYIWYWNKIAPTAPALRKYRILLSNKWKKDNTEETPTVYEDVTRFYIRPLGIISTAGTVHWRCRKEKKANRATKKGRRRWDFYLMKSACLMLRSGGIGTPPGILKPRLAAQSCVNNHKHATQTLNFVLFIVN